MEKRETMGIGKSCLDHVIESGNGAFDPAWIFSRLFFLRERDLEQHRLNQRQVIESAVFGNKFHIVYILVDYFFFSFNPAIFYLFILGTTLINFFICNEISLNFNYFVSFCDAICRIITIR